MIQYSGSSLLLLAQEKHMAQVTGARIVLFVKVWRQRESIASVELLSGKLGQPPIDPLPSMPSALLITSDEPRVLVVGFRDGRLWRGEEFGHYWEELPLQLESVLAIISLPE